MTEDNKLERSETVTESDKDSSESSTSSTGPDIKEPKGTSAKSSGAKPAPARVAPYAVVGAGPVDTVVYTAARPPSATGPRKSLTVHHLQRRLEELGYDVAASDHDGRYGDLTRAGVSAWQKDNDAEETGLLSRTQFKAVFRGDPNVEVLVDSHEDHSE